MLAARNGTSDKSDRRRTLIVFRRGCSYRAKCEGWLWDNGYLPYRVMDIGTHDGILGCVKAGMGLTGWFQGRSSRELGNPLFHLFEIWSFAPSIHPPFLTPQHLFRHCLYDAHVRIRRHYPVETKAGLTQQLRILHLCPFLSAQTGQH